METRKKYQDEMKVSNEKEDQLFRTIQSGHSDLNKQCLQQLLYLILHEERYLQHMEYFSDTVLGFFSGSKQFFPLSDISIPVENRDLEFHCRCRSVLHHAHLILAHFPKSLYKHKKPWWETRSCLHDVQILVSLYSKDLLYNDLTTLWLLI